MLEDLARKKSLTPAAAPRCRPDAALGSATHRRAFEFSCRTARACLSAEKRITKHPGHGIVSAQKMHLKTVGLFFCTYLGIDAADIRFRIGIGSSWHERLPNNYFKQRENQRIAMFYSRDGVFSGDGKSHAPDFFRYSSAGRIT